ncbi:MAG: ATP synthase F1 subunit epsilon [bacterium]
MSDLTIKLEIVTPERVVLKTEVLQAIIPTAMGEITILPHHVPLVAILQPGVIEVKTTNNAEVEIMAVSGGFVEVLKNKIVILADTAEKASDLNEERIAQAKQAAEELKKTAKAEDRVKFTDINARIEKELARSRAISRWKKLKNIKQN